VVSGDSVVSIGPGGVVVAGEGEDTVTIGPGGVVVGDAAGDRVRIGPEGSVVDERTGDRVTQRPDGSVDIESEGTLVTVDGDFVRIRDEGTVTTITGDWRTGTTSIYQQDDTDRLLSELGANVTAGEIMLDLSGDILFEFGSAAIQAAAAEQLAKVAHLIRQRSVGEVHVIGHTDSKGSDESNEKLSQARAVSVMRWLNQKEGVPASVMLGRGMGSKKPVAHNTMPDGSDNPAGRAKNRRVEIRFGTSS
jgi:outer membrane protein OmpA-like peptidoglycan-associated protein